MGTEFPHFSLSPKMLWGRNESIRFLHLLKVAYVHGVFPHFQIEHYNTACNTKYTQYTIIYTTYLLLPRPNIHINLQVTEGKNIAAEVGWLMQDLKNKGREAEKSIIYFRL